MTGGQCRQPGAAPAPQPAREDTVDANLSRQVHLVGSIGLDTVEDVFRDAGQRLGKYLRRIPDGEPGGRRLWISWQYPLLRSSPFLRADPSGAERPTTGFPLLCLGEGVSPSELRFGELGYAREARASYLDFCAARERGELPPHLKFQVCLPTPMGVAYSFFTQRDLGAIEPARPRRYAGTFRIATSASNGISAMKWS
jgi:hypothetical protein